MSQLDSRQVRILSALISADTSVSAARLGKSVGLSARMVRYHLPFLGQWLGERGVKLNCQPRMGISLDASPAARKKILAEFDRQPVRSAYRAEERRDLLLFELLSGEDYTSNSALEALLSVSHTTLARDMDLVECWLANHHLYLKKKIHHGWTVVGREGDFRIALVSLILALCPEIVLIDVYLWGKRINNLQGIHPYSVQAVILERLAKWNFSFVWRYVSQIEREIGASMVDHDHLFMVLYFMMMIRRCQLGRWVESPVENDSHVRTLKEYQVVKAVCKRVSRDMGLRIPEAEWIQLTMQIITSLRQSKSKALPEPLDKTGAEQGVSLDQINRLVNDLGRRTGYSIARQEVVGRLKDHLDRSLTRLRCGMPISNHLVGQVHQNYPELWQATQVIFRRFEAEQRISLPDEEMAFITMYAALIFDATPNQPPRNTPRVVVACPTGGVTVWMLVSRLRSELPNLEIVDIISMRELNRIDAGRADAIISTAVFQSRLPVITVSPFVTEQEVSRIRLELGIS